MKMPLPTPSTLRSLPPTLLLTTSVISSLLLAKLFHSSFSSRNTKRKRKEKEYAHTLFYGTFIQLPPSPGSGDEHKLSVTHGALWVSASDGRIEGFDWSVENEEGLRELLRKKGWVDVDRCSGDGDAERGVRVVRNERKNGFFFPGFIGRVPFFLGVVAKRSLPKLTNASRYSYSCFPVPEFRDIRVLHAAGLAGDLYVSPGGFVCW